MTGLSAKVSDRSATVGVIGLGYVGLPLLRGFHHAGFSTMGFDIDPVKVEALQKGRNYLTHLGDDFAAALSASHRFEATSVFDRLDEPDVVCICVPTPLGEHLEPDLSYVERTTGAIAKRLRPGQLVVLESTTYPTTTRLTVHPRLAESGLRCGEDFYLAYSPEREDPGREDFTTRSTPKLVGGVDEPSGAIAEELYRCLVDNVVRVRTAEIAEAGKLLENIFRAVNIALVNELKVLLTEMDINVWEVIDAAATKPFGFQAFYPGPGLGGHCIPIDPYYLTWKAREVGLPTRFIELAGEVNRSMPDHVVQRTVWALNGVKKPINGSRLLILGLAYKPDVNDVRESPSFELIRKLEGMGGHVDYNDPHVPATHPMRKYNFRKRSVALTPETLSSYDCVIVATAHSAYDRQQIADAAPLIVDTRNALRDVSCPRDHIFTA